MSVLALEQEPIEGSVVLSDGPTGTAWQRWFSDGKWHSSTGRTRSWESLLAYAERFKQPLVIAYTAPEVD